MDLAWFHYKIKNRENSRRMLEDLEVNLRRVNP